MAMVSFKSVYTKIADLIFRRVIFLFLIGIVLSFLLIDQGKLDVKTINTMLPSAVDIREFAYHPAQMDKRKIRNMLTYYKFVCDIMGPDTYDKPAACGIVGYAYYYLGDEKKAIDYLSMANKNYEHFFWINYNLGIIYYNQEHYEQAMNYFLQAKDAYPYTVGFLVTTRTYRHIAKSLKLNKEGLQQSLNQGAEYLKKIYSFSALLMQDPTFEKQFEKKKVDLRLL